MKHGLAILNDVEFRSDDRLLDNQVVDRFAQQVERVGDTAFRRSGLGKRFVRPDRRAQNGRRAHDGDDDFGQQSEWLRHDLLSEDECSWIGQAMEAYRTTRQAGSLSYDRAEEGYKRRGYGTRSVPTTIRDGQECPS